jgi:predicted nucleic-acid-binding protein
VIADGLLRLLRLPGLIVTDKDLLRETLALWVARTNLSYADCFHLLTAKAMGLTTIISFDRKLSIPGVTRVEPPLN